MLPVDAAKRPTTLVRKTEPVPTERQFDVTAALDTIEKLRYILHQLNSGQLPLEDLKRNIEYAALVLETAYMDETRRICDEDDDLAEVTPETVPDEASLIFSQCVREWLAATFTRQNAGKKREKPKFKSVANAIRTGIFFDKLFRKQQSVQCPIPPEIAELLREINSWSFNPFHLNEVSEGHALKYVGFELFNRYGFMDRFKIPLTSLENYLLALEQGYTKHNNPYHNVVHAADVTQSSHFMLSQTGLANSLGDLELLAVLFGALIHDYEHTGHTNNFHIQSGSNFALLYNDRSVLENHHVSSCYRLMKDEDKNIFNHLTRDEFRDLRNMVIEIVLATDMSTHFVQIKTMKNMLSLPEGIDKNKALCLIVHACDISHPSKPWVLHERWTEGVLEEFFRQGDLEASMGLPYSPLCDRHTVHVADSQIGFIDFIVEPTMLVCGELLTKMVEPLVSLPPTDSLFPPNGDHNESTSPSVSLSPLPDARNSSVSPSNIRRLPLSYCGKLEIPTPWMKFLHDNKACWKERAAKEEEERKKAEAEKAAIDNGEGKENGKQ
ncbi:3'5'-cyclic nucleotide phosphodiesterase [Necator americanus]|uniref:Phosphodiesterase n=1 Tax=Necator americanus TaxID=51031 RepID=W2SV48_NECAM|nr:3'5'-cyclic nucleotide phosphodiesterase [Necator americanus]ETN73619.1 3'5'-cyclic nucleotide phosphodiesterase [Necator americanus]